MRLRALLAWFLLTPLGALAGPPEARLYDLMGLPEMVETMRLEGLAMSADLAESYLDAPAGPAFREMVLRIYDPPRMNATLREAFEEGLGVPGQGVMAFYASPAGQQVVAAELATRRAFLEPGAERAAERAAELTQVEQPQLYAQVSAFIEANDLIDRNLGGALTANAHFYFGLVEGGAFALDEDEIFADVWQQEEATRIETELWLRAFLTAAYRDLSQDDMARYLALSESPEGQRLNAALFDAYAVLYNQIYHALGLSVSTLLSGEEL
ncbi:DUF2059 domain-containing protein [Oceanicola sp. S124]|uniref:DUF2059 domain-containing protein n=1 Tax=Oceanicola sp. S124 TaxID=1042378 RepID=UPI0002558507|nr:DUF2059 domain-containing protein [Oceanicola sp. S124]